jgi:hypothetical protein
MDQCFIYERFLRNIHNTERSKDSKGADADIMDGLMSAEIKYNNAKSKGCDIEETSRIYGEKLGSVKIYMKQAIEHLQENHQEVSEQLQECKDDLLDDDLNVGKIFEIIENVNAIVKVLP